MKTKKMKYNSLHKFIDGNAICHPTIAYRNLMWRQEKTEEINQLVRKGHSIASAGREMEISTACANHYYYGYADNCLTDEQEEEYLAWRTERNGDKDIVNFARNYYVILATENPEYGLYCGGRTNYQGSNFEKTVLRDRYAILRKVATKGLRPAKPFEPEYNLPIPLVQDYSYLLEYFPERSNPDRNKLKDNETWVKCDAILQVTFRGWYRRNTYAVIYKGAHCTI